jgi:hypothetical protein
MEQPNVPFIICDDLNDSVEGMGGHPLARRPSFRKTPERRKVLAALPVFERRRDC